MRVLLRGTARDTAPAFRPRRLERSVARGGK